MRVSARKPSWKAIKVTIDKGWERNNDAERHDPPAVGETASISIDRLDKERKPSLQAAFFKQGHADQAHHLLHCGGLRVAYDDHLLPAMV